MINYLVWMNSYGKKNLIFMLSRFIESLGLWRIGIDSDSTIPQIWTLTPARHRSWSILQLPIFKVRFFQIEYLSVFDLLQLQNSRVWIFAFKWSIFQCLSVLAVADRERVGPEGAVRGRCRRLYQVLHAAIPDAFRHWEKGKPKNFYRFSNS